MSGTQTPVLFRMDEGGVTAVFPCLPADHFGNDMTCYAHVGQHGACSVGWYQTTKAATPDQYAALKAELEAAPYHYQLRVVHRISQAMHIQRRKEAAAG